MSKPVIGFDPTAGIIAMIDSAFGFMNAAMQARAARIGAELRRDEIEFEKVQRDQDRADERERYQQARRDKLKDDQRAADTAHRLVRAQSDLGYYPFVNGPGSLRRSMQLTHENSATRPPFVLLLPAGQNVDKEWRSLPAMIEASLMPFQNREALVVRLAERWTGWPNSALIENDLYDLSTIVMAAEVIGGVLNVSLAGCNLGGGPRVMDRRQVAALALPGAEFWTESQLSALERTSPSGFRRPEHLDSVEARQRLQLEWANRLAVLSAIAAVDAFQLQHRTGYDEQIDAAAAMLDPEIATKITLPEPSGPLADHPYHLLHEARRKISVGDRTGASAAVVQAVGLLGGDEQVSVPTAIFTARATGRLKEWHRRLLISLYETTQPDTVVPDIVMHALAEPLPAAQKQERQPERRQLRAIRPGNLNDPWYTW